MGIAALEGFAMRSLTFAASTLIMVLAASAATSRVYSAEAAERATILTVVGVPGTPEYGSQFRVWAQRWQSAAELAGASSLQIGTKDETGVPDKEQLQGILAEQSKGSSSPFWLVLIGHGTFDGRFAKFNLRGLDITATELAKWLEPFERPVIVVNCGSSSGPFINKLSGKDRVVITGTKSGFEMNFARFGDYISAAVVDSAADLDKDGQTSLLEAFLLASARVREFYQQEARLATEQALLDDNGDARGTPASFFRGIHAARKATGGAALDGSRAHQILLVPNEVERTMPPETRARRDELEQQIEALRQQKAKLAEDEYYAQLEPLLIEFARLYRSLEKDEPQVQGG